MTDNDNRKLLCAALVRFVLGIAVVGLFLFLMAGNLGYWNAWLYIAAMAVSIGAFGVYLYKNDKELLQKRLKTKEKEDAQKAYTVLGGVSLVAAFVGCGLDYRFGWSSVPAVAVAIAMVAMLAGYLLFAVTLAQNSYASRVVEVQSGQKVIDTGVYAVVRHPMYVAAILLFLSSPVVLGSWYSAIPVVIYIAGIVLRIKNEEKVLRDGLPGYSEYMMKVRYRLIPLVW
jgi:protein-S-isoprenylcysteine O-methyltransferase Ste14